MSAAESNRAPCATALRAVRIGAARRCSGAVAHRTLLERVTVAGVALCITLTLPGCDRGGDAQSQDQQSTASEPGVDAGDLTDEQLNALRALPYAGYSEVAEDEHADGVVRFDRERACPGYNLYTIRNKCRAELVDMDGKVVRAWQRLRSSRWERSVLMPDGDLLVIGYDRSDLPANQIADESRFIQRLDWNDRQIWKRQLTVHHDVEEMPDGRLMTLTFSRRQLPAISATTVARDDEITLLNQSGEVLERMSLYDAVAARPEIFPLQEVAPSTVGGPEWIDIFHANSVEWTARPGLPGKHPIYEPGNILVSMRNQDRIAVFNLARRELIWAWGLGELSGQHDAQILENGHIMIFDNGMKQQRSRIIEFDPIRGEIVWTYEAPNPKSFYSMAMGGNQRLPNGNTLIADSLAGTAFEVTPAGDVVWEFRCPHRDLQGRRAAIVRMTRCPVGWVENTTEAD